MLKTLSVQVINSPQPQHQIAAKQINIAGPTKGMTSFMKTDAFPVMIFGITGTVIFLIALAGPGFACTSGGLLVATVAAPVLFGPIWSGCYKAATRLTRLLLNG
jgi:hypothetical protein